MRLGFIAFASVLSVAAVCQAQTPDAAAARLVAGCTTDAAYGVPFGERSDRMFIPAPDTAPYRAAATLNRTPNSRRLHSAEIVVELPDDATAIAFVDAVDSAATSSGRFPNRTIEEDSEIATLTTADGSTRLELSTLGRGAYIGCVQPELQQLAIDEAFGRVRVTERPAPPTLPMPPRPAANTCQTEAPRAEFIARFETALQGPMEYVSSLGRYSSTLQQWYSQQLKDKSNFTDEDDSALAMRTLNDAAFGAELNAGMRHTTEFLTAIMAFADARDAGNAPLACTSALNVLTQLDNMSASSQRQWGRIEALYREEASHRGVTLD